MSLSFPLSPGTPAAPLATMRCLPYFPVAVVCHRATAVSSMPAARVLVSARPQDRFVATRRTAALCAFATRCHCRAAVALHAFVLACCEGRQDEAALSPHRPVSSSLQPSAPATLFFLPPLPPPSIHRCRAAPQSRPMQKNGVRTPPCSLRFSLLRPECRDPREFQL
jgi:hypothetical protein